MSDFKRFQRVLKSWLPNFSTKKSVAYNYEDAKLMINELAYNIQPSSLTYLQSNNESLYHFLIGIEQLEKKIGKSITTGAGTIDEQFHPQGYEEGDRVWFTITYKGKERTIATYKIP